MKCCEWMAEHITCHNGCYELVSKDGRCAKCLKAEKQRVRVFPTRQEIWRILQCTASHIEAYVRSRGEI